LSKKNDIKRSENKKEKKGENKSKRSEIQKQSKKKTKVAIEVSSSKDGMPSFNMVWSLEHKWILNSVSEVR
jgi:hypothetical protein